jgi:acetyl esterase
MDKALAAWLERLGERVATLAGPDPDILTFRAASRAARLDGAKTGPPLPATDLALPGMAARLYAPPQARGLVVYLHGGGWVMLDLDTHDHILRMLAVLSGAAVLGLDYPRAPETRFPAVPDLCLAALRAVPGHPALAAHAGGGVILAGDSSGANLALALASDVAAAGLLLFYAVCDSDLTRPSYARFGRPPYLLSPARMAMFWNTYCPAALQTHPRAAPLRRPAGGFRGLPPVHLSLAGRDVLLDENLALALRLRDEGVPVHLAVDDDAPHGFIEAAGQSARADATLAAAAAWVRARLAG